MDDSDISGTCKPNIRNTLVDEETTKKVISKLNNNAAVGPDGLPVQVFKYGGNLIVEAVMDIMLESVKTQSIPSILKMGWITPIWKGEDLSDPKNYRPISLTPHLSKILERLVRSQITDYLLDS